MNNDNWDEFPAEELKKVASALIYLKRNFGTEVGNPEPYKEPNGQTQDASGTKKD